MILILFWVSTDNSDSTDLAFWEHLVDIFYLNLPEENPLGIQCGFRGSGKGQITCLLAHCHLFSSQFEWVLWCWAALQYTQGKVPRDSFHKINGFFPLDTDTPQALLCYKTFHHVQGLCQITIHKKWEEFLTVCFVWTQLPWGRWKPFLTGCGESCAMLHPLQTDLSMTWKQCA